jgi:hypothetical protein
MIHPILRLIASRSDAISDLSGKLLRFVLMCRLSTILQHQRDMLRSGDVTRLARLMQPRAWESVRALIRSRMRFSFP